MEEWTDLDEAVQGLSSLIVAGDTFRLAASVHFRLGLVETYAISYLYDHGPMTQADRGRLMGITSGGITGVVDRLERSDTAQRIPDPSDRRRKRLELTPRARDILRESWEGLARAFGDLDPGVVAVLGDALPRLAAGVTTEATALGGEAREDS